MSDISITPVVGIDGVAPVYQPEGRWTIWSIHEVWMGNIGNKRYVPKVMDYVIEPETYSVWLVTYLDPVTLIPTLQEIRPANMSFTLNETDILFGVGPGTQSDTYRVYLDQSVTPHVLAVDIRLKVAGTMASYAKIFKGSDLTESGNVISRVYDSNGNFISENIPLELVAIDSHNNYSIKTIKVCHTNEHLLDGEIVTAVIYGDNGHVVSKRQLLVENTSFIRSVDASAKYISHISVESAFISPTFDHIIEFPLNIPLNALNLMGVVHYSDGSTLKLPVDGSKFRMFGLEQYVSSIVGQTVDLVLSYALAPNEIAYTGVSTDNNYITEPYSLVTVNPNNSYTVKLFVYPVWLDEANGYTLKWFLLNLDRNVFFEVTPYVKFSENTGPFNPKGYGFLQRKSVTINLKDVSGAFKSFIHVQLVDIVLNGEPIPEATPWTVSHESVSSRPAYGSGLFAKRLGSNVVNIDSDITDFDEWKERMYLQTYPLVERSTEINPPNPTHFSIIYKGSELEYPIADWNKSLVLNENIELDIFSNLVIKFIKKAGAFSMNLSVASLMVKHHI